MAVNSIPASSWSDKVCDLAVGLTKDLGTCGLIVGLAIHGIKILVGLEVFFRILLQYLSTEEKGTIGPLHGIAVDGLCTIGGDNSLALDAYVLGHNQLHRELHGAPDHGHGNPGIARAGLDDGLPLF